MQLTLWDWIPAGSFQLDVGLLVDPLSMCFVMLITFVGSLIHVYSIGYMEHDPDKRRFFAYLNLFIASMLLLVLADSYLLLFVGWEGVGLASYLLIGFWNWNPAYATRRQQGVLRQPGRRPRPAHRDHADVRHLRRGRLRHRRRGRGHRQLRGAHRDGPAPARGGLRQVGAVPAAVLARRRDGRPDTGVGAHPRRDHGHRRRLPHRPLRRHLHRHPRRPARGGVRRCDHADLRGDHRLRQGRHQEGPRGLHDEPDRLHDAGRRPGPGRLRLRDLPPAHPRLLQGRDVPRGRVGHARHERPGQHAPLRRAVAWS